MDKLLSRGWKYGKITPPTNKNREAIYRNSHSGCARSSCNMKFIFAASAVARQCENSVCFLHVRARLSASIKAYIDPSPPWYYTIAGVYLSRQILCGVWGGFGAICIQFSFIATICHEVASFRGPPPRVR